MRIGIDIQSTVGRKTGIGWYTRNLLDGLSLLDKENGYFYYHNGREFTNVLGRVLWEQRILPGLAKKDNLDIFHSPGFAPPLARPPKVIATVHDLIGMIFPENLGFFSRIYWSKILPFCVKKAERIIADSRSTKNDLIRLLRVKPDKIDVVYLGVNENFKPCRDLEEMEQLKRRYAIDGEFILHVGTIEPRKNLNTLMRAYKKLKDKRKITEKLVLVGHRAWAYEDLKSMIRELGLEKDVTFLDYVPDEDLPKLYSAARLFVFPSIYEGFGLPVLEAMACGRAVVASRASSLPEITSDSAVLVDPRSVEELSGAIFGVLSDEGKRQKLSEKARLRAGSFSWAETAKQTLAVYNKA